MIGSRAQRHRREHATAMARLRVLTDRPLPPRRIRVRLAVAYLALVGTVATVPLVVTAPVWGPAVQLVALTAIGGVWVALRRATRLVTEAPDEALDELLVRLRDRYFREAYQALAAAVALAAAAMITVGDRDWFGPGIIGALGLALVALATGLPLVVAAFRLPDIDDEDIHGDINGGVHCDVPP